MEEVKKALSPTSSGKAPGTTDGIPAELFTSLGPAALGAFHNVFTSIWKGGDRPEEFRDAAVISLFKNKGSEVDCSSYRGSSLLAIAEKISARVFLNHLIAKISEENLPEAKCGFRPGRSTTDMIFSVRQFQEECTEQNMDFYAVFLDLTKVNREVLWLIPSKFDRMSTHTRIHKTLTHTDIYVYFCV